MTEYVITPDKKEIPSSYLLSEELHRRALTVEMEVHGTNTKWENIYFFDPANPGTQCFLERNLHSLVYKISLAAESTHESEELQTTLVEIILHEVGGKVFNPTSKESYDLAEFRKQSGKTGSVTEFNNVSYSSLIPARSLPPLKEILWIGFSWAFVLLGFYFYRHVPQPRKILMLVACGLALMSAVGITFSSLQSNERG
jgi:hypothetical protein